MEIDGSKHVNSAYQIIAAQADDYSELDITELAEKAFSSSFAIHWMNNQKDNERNVATQLWEKFSYNLESSWGKWHEALTFCILADDTPNATTLLPHQFNIRQLLWVSCRAPQFFLFKMRHNLSCLVGAPASPTARDRDDYAWDPRARAHRAHEQSIPHETKRIFELALAALELQSPDLARQACNWSRIVEICYRRPTYRFATIRNDGDWRPDSAGAKFKIGDEALSELLLGFEVDLCEVIWGIEE